tara:strand:+ start:40 stop:444 length:405 start_codon:yes stop_codon:yes gene_type:complete
MKKTILTERFQQLAGIKPLYELTDDLRPEEDDFAFDKMDGEMYDDAGDPMESVTANPHPEFTSGDLRHANIEYNGNSYVGIEFEREDEADDPGDYWYIGTANDGTMFAIVVPGHLPHSDDFDERGINWEDLVIA